jgi:hypothetical protein
MVLDRDKKWSLASTAINLDAIPTSSTDGITTMQPSPSSHLPIHNAYSLCMTW